MSVHDKGAIVRVDYSLFDNDTGRLIESTVESDYKAAGLPETPGRTWRPLAIILGNGMVHNAFERHIMDEGIIGVPLSMKLSPAEAYGERKRPEVVPLKKADDKKAVKAGASVTVEGRKGTVVRVAGGRVHIDFNHPMAGKTLRFDYCVREAPNDPAGIVETLGEMVFGTKPPVAIHEKRIAIHPPPRWRFRQDRGSSESWLVWEIHKRLQDYEVAIVDVYAPPPKTAEQSQGPVAVA